ncbi:MAG TPA: hypothetical protein DCM28_22305 [Phycisphaerales bacterium]|nr:hypothetical protein [Phycisphaerales bacterium]HCD34456.1 hypothetical protein [Phycisphaerales bacterium]|tara:strand:+ start:130 stop:1221 length:1092 start_codon:yes stop_codon:yes gene_type:complete
MVYLTQYMTDFDLKPDTQQMLQDAVFGGAKPSIAKVRSIVRAAKLTWPHEVMTVRLPADDLSSRRLAALKKLNIKLLHLHPGLLYIFTDQRTDRLESQLAKQFRLLGTFYPCQSPASWVHAIQQSIILLRSEELAQVHEQPDSLPPSLQDEIDAMRIALGQIIRHEPHWQTAVDLWLRTVLLRHRQHLHDVRRKITEFIAAITRTADINASLSFVFNRAMSRIYATHAFSDFPLMVREVISDLLVYLPSDEGHANAQSPMVRDAISFLHEHATEPVSLSDVAKHVHVSGSHLAREFRSQTGMSLIQYLHRLRVSLAKRKLYEHDDTILTVALDCGFESVEHFHRIFKRQVGMTPHRYRVMSQQ